MHDICLVPTRMNKYKDVKCSAEWEHFLVAVKPTTLFETNSSFLKEGKNIQSKHSCICTILGHKCQIWPPKLFGGRSDLKTSFTLLVSDLGLFHQTTKQFLQNSSIILQNSLYHPIMKLSVFLIFSLNSMRSEPCCCYSFPFPFLRNIRIKGSATYARIIWAVFDSVR